MTCIRNGGATAALVLGYILYPGETRDVPDKIAGLLIEGNPQLVLCHPPRPVLQPQPALQPQPGDAPRPEDDPQADAAPTGKRRK